MGKALIIKGADFSAVAAEDIVIGGDIILTRDNASSSVNGYLTGDGASAAITPSQTEQLLFYPISAGKYLYVPGQSAQRQVVALVRATEYGVSGIYATDAGKIARNEGFPGDIIIRATVDCYVALMSLSGGNDIFPEGCKICDSVETPSSLSLSNYIYGANVYLKQDGTWEAETTPAQDYAGVLYNVHAGDVITVTPFPGKNAFFAFLNFDKNNIFSGTASFAQGEGRYKNADEATYTVEHECILYVYAYASGNLFLPTITVE